MSATRPSTSSVSESVKRPRRDGGRAGLVATGGGGGGLPRPGYGYGLLAYGPCGANGGRYPGSVGGTVSVAAFWYIGGGPTGAVVAAAGSRVRPPQLCRLASRTAAPTSTATTTIGRSSPNTKEPADSAAASPTITTRIGEVPDRPRPNSASSGEPVSPSAGMSSQPTTYRKMLRPPARVRTAKS